MRIFEDDDAGYLTWIDGHQHGFVVNTFRKPDPRYLILHRASRGTIRGKPSRGDRWTTGEFLKACAERRADLDQWARQIAGGELQPCGRCRPDCSRSLPITAASATTESHVTLRNLHEGSRRMTTSERGETRFCNLAERGSLCTIPYHRAGFVNDPVASVKIGGNCDCCSILNLILL